MNADLARALQVVEHDLRIAGVPLPEVRDVPEQEWRHHAHQPCAMLLAVDGSGQGVSCLVNDAPVEQLRSVADQVQEWVHEELCRLERSVAWPRCPTHPLTHPLSAVVIDEAAWWVCPLDRRGVSPIGQLGVTARSSRPTRGGR